MDLGQFALPADYQDRIFFVIAGLRDPAGKLVSRSVYWPRTLSMLADAAARAKFRARPTDWPALTKGPWLKPTVAKSRTTLAMDLVSSKPLPDGGTRLEVRVRNTGRMSSFPTSLDISGARRTFFAGDNVFWLAAGESRTIPIQIHAREKAVATKIEASAWNADPVKVEMRGNNE